MSGWLLTPWLFTPALCYASYFLLPFPSSALLGILFCGGYYYFRRCLFVLMDEENDWCFIKVQNLPRICSCCVRQSLHTSGTDELLCCWVLRHCCPFCCTSHSHLRWRVIHICSIQLSCNQTSVAVITDVAYHAVGQWISDHYLSECRCFALGSWLDKFLSLSVF